MPRYDMDKIKDTQIRILGNNKIKYLGTKHMANTRAYEPQTTNNYDFQLTFDDAQKAYINRYLNNVGLPAETGHSGTSLGSGSELSERLSVSLRSFNAPDVSLGRIVVPYQNNGLKFAGKPEYGDASISFQSFIGARSKQILKAWFNLGYDSTTEEGGFAYTYPVGSNNADHAGYKCEGYLLETARNGLVVASWKLIGCWLMSFGLGQFDAEGGHQMISGTLSCDSIEEVSLA